MNATNIFLQLFFNGWNENQCLFHFFECNDTRRKRDFKLLYENVLELYHPVLKNITKIVFKIFRNFSKSESFYVSTHYTLIIIIHQRFKFNFNKNKIFAGNLEENLRRIFETAQYINELNELSATRLSYSKVIEQNPPNFIIMLLLVRVGRVFPRKQ